MGSSTESKVFLETTRTTSQTMRMEHKTSFNDLPPITHSQRTQTPSILQVSEGTMIDKEFTKKEESKTNEFTQTQTQTGNLPKFEPVPYPFETDNVDSATSAPVFDNFKSNAREFFENNLKDLPPLQDDKYTRFDEAFKKNNKNYTFKQNEIKEQFQTKLVEDLSYLNLKPEPPPELGFMPKVQQTPPEKIVEKVKKLEEIHHKTNDAPLSGTLHPPSQMFRKSPSPIIQQPQQDVFSQNYQKVEKREFSSTFERTSSPLPPFDKEKLSTNDPFSSFRSASPKPSLEAVNMEKLWASKPKTPEPLIKESFSQEHKSSFVAYSTNQTQNVNIQQPPQSFVSIQPMQNEVQDEMPKTSMKETKSFFEQKFKEESMSHDFKSPGLVKQFAKPMTPVLPPIDIEPGAPPEICYAPKPTFERRQSYVEKVEKALEQNLDKEPERVPRGGVRIIPTRQTPQRGMAAPSPQRNATPQRFEVAPSPQQMFSLPPKQDIVKPEPIVAPRVAQPFEPFKSTFVDEKIENQSETMKTSLGYRHVEPPKLGKQIQQNSAIVPPPTLEPIETFKKIEEFSTTTNESKQSFSSIVQNSVPFVQQPKPFVQQPQAFVPKPAPFVQQPISTAPQPTPLAPLPQTQPVSQPDLLIPQSHAPKQSPQPFKPKPKYSEVVAQPQGAINLYRNFVKAEQNMHSSESYFQKVERVESRTQSQNEQEIKSQFQQVRKQFYPDVML